MIIIILELAKSGRISVIVRLVLTVTPAEGWYSNPSLQLVNFSLRVGGGDEIFIVCHGNSLVWYVRGGR